MDTSRIIFLEDCCPSRTAKIDQIANPRTLREYQSEAEDFCGFVGLAATEEFRAVIPLLTGWTLRPYY